MINNQLANNILNLIQAGSNPQQIIMNYLSQELGRSPMGQNLLYLAQQGKTKEIEQIARNLSQAKGIDYDKEFNAFCNRIRR